jgi:hypothetical protein
MNQVSDITSIEELFELILIRHVVLSEMRDIYRIRLKELLGKDENHDFYIHG